MKLFLSKSLPDEDGPLAEEGKHGIIFSSKEDLLRLCQFFAAVEKEVHKYDNIHMHFRDSFDEWNRNDHIDIEVNIE